MKFHEPWGSQKLSFLLEKAASREAKMWRNYVPKKPSSQVRTLFWCDHFIEKMYVSIEKKNIGALQFGELKSTLKQFRPYCSSLRLFIRSFGVFCAQCDVTARCF